MTRAKTKASPPKVDLQVRLKEETAQAIPPKISSKESPYDHPLDSGSRRYTRCASKYRGWVATFGFGRDSIRNLNNRKESDMTVETEIPEDWEPLRQMGSD